MIPSLRSTCALAIALALDGPALAEAPAAGETYVIPLGGLPVMEISESECFDELGALVCIDLDATTDLAGRISGSGGFEVIVFGAGTFRYAGPLSGRVTGVASRDGELGYTKLRFRMNLTGTASLASGTHDSSFLMTCTLEGAHARGQVDVSSAGTCQWRMCVRGVPGFRCLRDGGFFTLDFPFDSEAAQLVVNVDRVNGRRVVGDAQLQIAGQPATDLVLRGNVNERKGFGNLNLRGARGRLNVKRLEVDAGGAPTGGRIVYRVMGHRGTVELD